MITSAYSASKRPTCIASVRVEALRASGLRAAAAQRVSSLHGEEPIPDIVLSKHFECLQGTGISCSSNASLSSSITPLSISPSSCTPSTPLQASLHSSTDKCFVPHPDSHLSAKDPSSCGVLDDPSSCNGRVYKRRKFGENTIKKYPCTADNSSKPSSETLSDASHNLLPSSLIATIHPGPTQHMHPYKSRKYFSKNLAAVDNSSSSSSTAVMGFSGNSDNISDAPVVEQVSEQGPQCMKLIKALLDANDRRPSLRFGNKSSAKDIYVYETPKQTQLPEEFGRCIGQQGSTCRYAKTKDKRVHTRLPSSLHLDNTRSLLVLEEKALSKDNHICGIKGKTKAQDELVKYIKRRPFTTNYAKVKENIRLISPLDVNNQRSFSALAKKTSGKDDGVHEIPGQTKIPDKLGRCTPQETSTHSDVKVKDNRDKVGCPSSLGVRDGKSSSVLGKRVLCKDYKTTQKTEPRGQCVQPQDSAYSFTEVKENSVHTRCHFSSNVTDPRSSIVLGKRTSRKAVYKALEQTTASVELGESIQHQASTFSCSIVKRNNVHTRAPLFETRDCHQINASINLLPEKEIIGLCSLAPSKLMMHSTETKSSSIHPVEAEDIGPDTQIALEAIELMVDGAEVRANDIHIDEKEDVGFSKQTTVQEIILKTHDSTSNLDENISCEPNTQCALDAIDIMRNTNTDPRDDVEQDANAHGEDMDIGANTQIALEAMNLMTGYTMVDKTTSSVEYNSHAENGHVTDIDIGANTQVALEAMDLMMSHAMMNETSMTGYSHVANVHQEDRTVRVNGNSLAANANVEDVGTSVDTRMALEEMDITMSHAMMSETASIKGNSHTANAYVDDLEISACTQIALEAMDLMKGHSRTSGTVSEKGISHPPNTYGENGDADADTEMALKTMDLMIDHGTMNETGSIRGKTCIIDAYGEDMDTGANTQVALEAINLIMGHTNEKVSVTCNSDAANLFREIDIGSDTQMALEAMDSMIGCTMINETASSAGNLHATANVRGNLDAEILFGEKVEIGADTQIALQAIDLMTGHIMMNETVSAAGNLQATANVRGNSDAKNLIEEEVDIGADTQIALEAMNLMTGHTNLNETTNAADNLYVANAYVKNASQIALTPVNLVIAHATLNETANVINAHSEAVNICADAQMALEGMDLMIGHTSNHNLGRCEIQPSDVATSTHGASVARHIMRGETKINQKFMEMESRQKDIAVGPRKVAQQFLNRGRKNPGGEASRKKKTPASKLERNAVDKNITINSKMSSDLAVIGGACTPKSFAITSADNRNTVETVLVKARKEVMDRKNSPFSFLISAIPRKKRTPRRTLISSSSRNVLVFQQDGENKVCKPGFGKRVHPQKHNGKKQKLAILAESTKRTLSETTRKANTLEAIINHEKRKTKKREPSCVRVLFSHSLPNDVVRQQKKILTRLGGQTTNQAADSTHFVSNAFVRTKNMLESLASGKNIVTTLWLEGCNQAHHFVDEKEYILRDLKKEKELGFCMHSSLAASRQKPLLEGMTFIVSPNTVPDFEGMSAIIKSAGGQVTQTIRTVAKGSNSTPIVIASKEDFKFCASFLKRGITIYSTEFILHGIIIQSLDFSRNHLFEDHYK